MKKTRLIALNVLPVALMIALIPLIQNDYLLTLAYAAVIAVSLSIKTCRRDFTAFFFGLIALTASEYFFVKTGAEVFTRRTLFGAMPIWLPVLWAYSFIAIKRVLAALDA